MAGYSDTKKLIEDTLVGRPEGSLIYPYQHQRFALSMLDYIHSVELMGVSDLQGIATTDTVPVEPENAKVAYIATVPPSQTYVYTNFLDENGDPITITTGANTVSLLTLLWNGTYWQVQNSPVQLAVDYSDGFLLKDVISTDVNPGTPDLNMFYIALPGTYTHFTVAPITVKQGQLGIFTYENSAWSSEVFTIANWSVVNVNDINGSATAYGSSQIARTMVPLQYRKCGLQITYLLSTGWITEQYIGPDESASTPTPWPNWGTSSNWQVLGPVSVSQNTITLQEWQPNTDYVVGNQCQNDGHYYRCTTAHTSGETFDVADGWTEITDFIPENENYSAIQTINIGGADKPINQNIINLVYWGAAGADAVSAINIGQVGYYSDRHLLAYRFRETGVPRFYIIPFQPNAIYRYNDDLFVWDGANLVKKTFNIDDGPTAEGITTAEFAISDKDGYEIARFKDGHIKTKKFDSSKTATEEFDGLMSKENVEKLNGIEDGAEENNTITDVERFGDFSISDEHGNIIVKFKNGGIKTKYFDSKDIEDRVSILEGKTNLNTFLTIGDSLTEGSGSGTNYKGETASPAYTYTSWMQTKTNKYIFSRHGIGGENSPAILGRMYGAPLVVGEKFTLPSDTSTVQINVVSSWYDKVNEERRSQNLGGASGTVRDTNPCTINGIPVTLSLSGGTYYVQRNTVGDAAIDILADTPIITNNFNAYAKTSYGLVFWCGTNDGASAEFTEELIKHIRKTAEKYNTDRFVVVGIHEINATKTLAVRQRQEVQFQDAFGDKFINWREYACNFAIRDAIARGYIENTGVYPTAADITAMNEGKVPPTLMVDSVHLCCEGYMLVGDLIFERLVQLGYINLN